MICPKCGHQRTPSDDPVIPDYQCPACDIIYAKYKPSGSPNKEISASVLENIRQARNQIKTTSPTLEGSQKYDSTTTFLKSKLSKKELIINLAVVSVMGWLFLHDGAEKPDRTTKKTEHEKPLTAQNKEQKKQSDIGRQQEAYKQSEIENEKREAACQLDENCSARKAFAAEATVNCVRGIEHMSKYRFKWTDGWMQPKIDRFKWKDATRTIVQGAGNYIELENGFGAWQPHMYICEVRVSDGNVIDIKMSPGRL